VALIPKRAGAWWTRCVHGGRGWTAARELLRGAASLRLQVEQTIWNGVAVQMCLERLEREGSRHSAMCSTK
jgi:hypothetical protein